MVTTLVIAILAGLLGLALCFVGYRFFLVMLPIWGFLAGLWIGATTTSMLFGGGFLGTILALVVGFVLGIAGSILSYFFYTAGVALIGAAFGGMLASAIMGALGLGPGVVTTIVILVSAIIAAGLTLLLNIQKLVIILFTAIAGAALLVVGAMVLFGQITPAELQAGGGFLRPIFEGSWFWGLITLILAAAGTVVQFRTCSSYAFAKEEYVEGWG